MPVMNGYEATKEIRKINPHIPIIAQTAHAYKEELDKILRYERNEEIKVVDDVFMSPTYTKDAAIMIKKVLDKNLIFGIYHMNNEGYCSWHEFAREIFNLTNMEPKLKAINSEDTYTKAKRPKFSGLENGNLEKNGFRMQSWRIALKEYLTEKRYI